MGLVFLIALAAFLLAVAFTRVVRRRIIAENSLSPTVDTELSGYPLSAVIQELKQQKFALESEQQHQKRLSKMSESIASTVIANLPCGVLFIAPSGLVRQANTAARQMLGFASPVGMRVEELLGGAPGAATAVPEVLDALASRPEGRARAADLEISCQTPAGDARVLKLGVIPLREPTGEALGAAVLIRDETRQAKRRQEEAACAETSAELALELHTSLLTICACAEQMGSADDRQQVRNLAQDISLEAARLDKVVGGFLARNGAQQIAARAQTTV
jgi:PAS domain-containing protein